MCNEMVVEQIGVRGFAGVISDVDYASEARCVVVWMFVCHDCIVCVSVQYVRQREVSYHSLCI